MKHTKNLYCFYCNIFSGYLGKNLNSLFGWKLFLTNRFVVIQVVTVKKVLVTEHIDSFWPVLSYCLPSAWGCKFEFLTHRKGVPSIPRGCHNHFRSAPHFAYVGTRNKFSLDCSEIFWDNSLFKLSNYSIPDLHLLNLSLNFRTCIPFKSLLGTQKPTTTKSTYFPFA